MKNTDISNALENNGFAKFSEKYYKTKKELDKIKKRLDNLEYYIDSKENFNNLFVKYTELNGTDELFKFLNNHPLFNDYIKLRVYFDGLNEDLYNYNNLFDINKIQLYKDCNHIFGNMNGKITCLNCLLNEDDLNIHSLEELEVFKNILIYQNRFVGDISRNEEAYASVIYDQHLKTLVKEK